MSELNPDCHNHIGPYECCSIITGDARELAKEIPNESVDLIFTDPPYEASAIPLYKWVSEAAARVLKPSGILLVYLGHLYFRDQLQNAGMIYSGLSPDGELVEICELANHPWMVSCQFHPEFKSRPGCPHPLFCDFIGVAKNVLREGAQVSLPLES